MARPFSSQRPSHLVFAASLLALAACGGADSSESSTEGGGTPGASGGNAGSSAKAGAGGTTGQAGNVATGGMTTGKGGASQGGASQGGASQGGTSQGGAGQGGKAAGGKAQGGSGGKAQGGSAQGGAGAAQGGEAGSGQGGEAGSAQGGEAGSAQGGEGGSGQGGDAGASQGGASQGGAGGSPSECAVDGDCAQSPGGTTCCAGKCVNVQTDAQNCGVCGTSCGPVPNAAASCEGGACKVKCDGLHYDCDLDPSTGCESAVACTCTPGKAVGCYEGPNGTANVGQCKAGTRTCLPDGSGYGACEGQVLPGIESCNEPGDEDCDGQSNEEGAGCSCVPGATAPCYTGPAGTLGVGKCTAGLQTCNDAGTDYGPCVGDVTPQAESCLTVGDDDCDGQADEEGAGCVCTPGQKQPCYTGPVGTEFVGACTNGTETCLPDGTGYGPCEGEVTPQAETCLTPFDDDCDGLINEEGEACVCVPGTTAPCYEGPAGTENVGICKAGLKLCSPDGTSYGACDGQVLPATEICGSDVDEDCNGSALYCNDAAQDCSPQSGQCVDACAPEIIGSSYIGCEYYPTITANLVNHNNFTFAVAISNTSTKPATVNITRGTGNYNSTVTVAANSVQLVNLPWDLNLKGPTSLSVVPMPGSVRVNQGAYRLVSNRPVTVYQYNPLAYTIGGNCLADTSRCSFSNDASLLMPVNVWTGSYRVMSRHHFAGASGFLAVTAKDDGTTVTLAKGPKSGIVKAGVNGIATSGNGTVSLNRGDVIEIVTDGSNSQSDPNDVTGTLVTADKPVQVIGGHQCTFIPDTTGYCDHLEESMFPIETLSNEYIVSTTLISGTTPKATMVRVMGIDPNVSLTYDPPQAGAPAALGAAGDWQEFQSSNSFKITGSGKFMVTQYMLGQDAGGNSGDPAMTLAVTTQQFRTDYLFHAPTNYERNYVNITSPVGTTVLLDGAQVAGFTAVGATGYEVARVQLPNVNGGNHAITATAPVGITVYGYGQYTSYWYPGGLDLHVIQ